MAVAGRKLIIYEGTGPGRVMVAGAKTDKIKINNEAIDITDKGDNGWRTFMNDASVRSVEMSVEGILKGTSLVAKSLGETTDLIDVYEIDIDGVGKATGNFHFSSMEIDGADDDAAKFSATIQSSGEIIFTPAV